MDSERGVYVVTADANGPLRDFIQANDVILQINEYPVADLEAMGAALEKVREEQRIKVVVFRGQKEQTIWMDGNLVEHWTLE
jgi:S1-C subfamily serine protease